MRRYVDPRTPGAKLKAALDERGERYTAFARRIGRNYHNVVRWFRNEEFTDDNKGLCAVALGLPADYFGEARIVHYEDSAAFERRRLILDEWLATSPNAKALSDPEIALLRTMRFDHPSLPPSAELFDGVAYALRGAIRVDELLTFEEDNRALSESLAQKPPPKKR